MLAFVIEEFGRDLEVRTSGIGISSYMCDYTLLCGLQLVQIPWILRARLYLSKKQLGLM